MFVALENIEKIRKFFIEIQKEKYLENLSENMLTAAVYVLGGCSLAVFTYLMIVIYTGECTLIW